MPLMCSPGKSHTSLVPHESVGSESLNSAHTKGEANLVSPFERHVRDVFTALKDLSVAIFKTTTLHERKMAFMEELNLAI